MSTLRQMTALDLLALTPVNLDAYTETYNISFYLEYLSKWPHLCHVLVDPTDAIEGYIIGKLESSPHLSPSPAPYDPDTNTTPHYLPWHAHITALSVAPGVRRLGHAHRLTEVLERAGDAADAWFVDLYVREDNVAAQRLYEGMGYSVYRTVKEYYNDGTDALDMRKSLARDVKAGKKHVREEGRSFVVGPDDVW